MSTVETIPTPPKHPSAAEFKARVAKAFRPLAKPSAAAPAEHPRLIKISAALRQCGISKDAWMRQRDLLPPAINRAGRWYVLQHEVDAMITDLVAKRVAAGAP